MSAAICFLRNFLQHPVVQADVQHNGCKLGTGPDMNIWPLWRCRDGATRTVADEEYPVVALQRVEALHITIEYLLRCLGLHLHRDAFPGCGLLQLQIDAFLGATDLGNTMP